MFPQPATPSSSRSWCQRSKVLYSRHIRERGRVGNNLPAFFMQVKVSHRNKGGMVVVGGWHSELSGSAVGGSAQRRRTGKRHRLLGRGHKARPKTERRVAAGDRFASDAPRRERGEERYSATKQRDADRLRMAREVARFRPERGMRARLETPGPKRAMRGRFRRRQRNGLLQVVRGFGRTRPRRRICIRQAGRRTPKPPALEREYRCGEIARTLTKHLTRTHTP